VNSEDKNANLRNGYHQPLRRVDTVQAGHREIQNRDIRFHGTTDFYRGTPVGSLTDLPLGMRAMKDLDDSAAQEFVVIRNKNSDRVHRLSA
jgi:hypothetical protein